MATFSDRAGITKPRDTAQVKSMDTGLRTQLWNVFYLAQRDHADNQDVFYSVLWMNYFERPIDEVPRAAIVHLRNHFFNAAWWEVYNLLEFLVLNEEFLHEREPVLAEWFNTVLEREMAGYRIIDGVVTEVTDAHEVEAIEEAIETAPKGARRHLENSLKFLSHRKSPDYRNSIKESISAVESVVRKITANPKATLGDGLKVMEAQHGLHPAMRGSFTQLYGYTSDEGGIRHALADDSREVSFEEAKFMLVACSAFVNFALAASVKNA